MATEKQIAANRENAKKSTGPKSCAGKAIVSRNAIRHGLQARHTMALPGEEQEYERFAQSVRDELMPDSPMLCIVVEKLIAAAVSVQPPGVQLRVLPTLSVPTTAGATRGSARAGGSGSVARALLSASVRRV